MYDINVATITSGVNNEMNSDKYLMNKKNVKTIGIWKNMGGDKGFRNCRFYNFFICPSTFLQEKKT